VTSHSYPDLRVRPYTSVKSFKALKWRHCLSVKMNPSTCPTISSLIPVKYAPCSLISHSSLICRSYPFLSLVFLTALTLNAEFGFTTSAFTTFRISISTLGTYVQGPSNCHYSPIFLITPLSLNSKAAFNRKAVFWSTVSCFSTLPTNFSPG